MWRELQDSERGTVITVIVEKDDRVMTALYCRRPRLHFLLFLLLCMPRLASAFGGSRKEKGDIKVSLYICIYVYMI